MRKVAARLAPIVLISLLTACPVPEQDSPGTTDGPVGSLKIALPLTGMQDPARPDPTVVVAYDVSGEGPEGAAFAKRGVAGDSVTVDSLTPGEWTVTVKGNNVYGMELSTGSAQVKVVEGDTATAEVTMAALTGDGSLDLYMKWESTNTFSAIDVTTTAASPGSLPQKVALDSRVVTGGFASYNDSFPYPPGYYTLAIAYEYGPIRGGAAIPVYISAGDATRFVIRCVEDVTLAVEPDIVDGSAVSLRGVEPSLAAEDLITVTAVPTGKETGKNAFTWYLNGRSIGTQSSVMIGSLTAGDYRLDVVVWDGHRLTSNHADFVVK